jgi:hypothetical protein
VLPFSEPFNVGGESMLHPHDPNASAENTVQCVVEGEVVLPIGDLLSIARARWDGECVEIVTADGVRLKVTPNHPILTTTGFRPAGEIKSGDQVITIRQPVNEPDDNDRPPTVEELYRACREAPMSLVHVTSGMNFHGDRPHGNIEIVWPHGYLRSGFHVIEHLDDGALMSVGDRLIPLASRSTTKRRLQSTTSEVITREPTRLIVGDDAARPLTRGAVGSASDSALLLQAGVSEADHVGFTTAADSQTHLGESLCDDVPVGGVLVRHGEHAETTFVVGSELPLVDLNASSLSRLRQIAEGNSVLDESSLDRLIAAPVEPSDGVGTFASDVAISDVVDVKIESGSHWVYNLTSSTGFLWSPAAIHSNCRCILLEFWPGDTRPDGTIVGESEAAQVSAEFLQPLGFDD